MAKSILMRQLSVIVFVILTVYLALVRPLTKQSVNMLESEIKLTTRRLERYIPKQGLEGLPTKDALKSMEAYLKQDEKNYQKLKKFIDPQKDYLPEGTEEPGLYFTEQTHIISKRLKRQATAARIKIPENLGITSSALPEDSKNMELLLKQLDLIDRIMSLLLEQEVNEVSLIKALDPVERRGADTEKLLFKELPIQLSFLCNSSSFVKILYQIKNFSPVLIIKDIIIKRTAEDALQIDILLSRLVLS